MSDHCLTAPNRDAFLMACKGLGIWDEVRNTYRPNGLANDGKTHFWILDIGAIWRETGQTTVTPEGETVPVMEQVPGYHFLLRWEAVDGYEPPEVPPGFTEHWRSGQTDENGDPTSPPAWWSGFFA